MKRQPPPPPRTTAELQAIAAAFRGLVILAGATFSTPQRELLLGLALRLETEAKNVDALIKWCHKARIFNRTLDERAIKLLWEMTR